MVKTLRDRCLDCLYKNFEQFTQSRLNLPTSICEAVLRRLINHDRLAATFLSAITYNWISSRLEKLDFYGSEQLNNKFFANVAMVCTNLRYVRLIRCLNVTDIGLAELLRNQAKLEHLELRWLNVKGHCFGRLDSLNNLKTLILKGCSYVCPKQLSSFVRRNRGLKMLNFRGLRKMNDKTMMDVATILNTNLYYVNISECLNITDFTLNALADHCPNLKRFSMKGCTNLTKDGLTRLLKSCRDLKKFDLSFCSRWRQNAINVSVIELLPKALTSLSLTEMQIDCSEERFCFIMEQLPNLSALYLNGFGLLSDQFLELLLARIGSKLTDFDLSGSYGKISDVGLDSIGQHCTNLRHFGAALLNGVTGRGLKPLFADRTRAERLRALIFKMCSTIDYDVLMLIAENCCGLEKIDVSGVYNVDDFVLNTLANTCPRLQSLFAHNDEFGLLKITDDSVCQLAAKCTNLKILSLSGNDGISDRSILALANHCHYLQELHLIDCNFVSQTTIRYLRDQSIDRVSVYRFFISA